VVMSLSLSLSPQSSCSGLHEDVRVVLPGDHPGQVLSMVVGGGEDDPLLNGVSLSISL
jgi:hypothetical protein